MNERTNREAETLAAVEDALHTYPLAPIPVDLAPKVLARIRARPAAPQFRLTWLDYAVMLLSAFMLGLVWFCWEFVTPESLAELQLQLGILLPNVNLELVAVVSISGMVLIGAALVLAWLLFGPIAGFTHERVRYIRARG